MVYKIFPISTVILTSFSCLFALFNTLLQMLILQELSCEQCSILLTLRKLLLQTLQNGKHSNTAWRICVSHCNKFRDRFYPWDRILYGDEEGSKNVFENDHNSETPNTAFKCRSNLKAPRCHNWEIISSFAFWKYCRKKKKNQATTKSTMLPSMKFHNINF